MNLFPVQSPKTLRDYQRAAVDRLKRALGRDPVLVAPTGSGKTVMGSALVTELGVPTLWLAHRKELVDQAARSLSENGLHVGIIKAGYAPDPTARVQVASIGTLTRRDKPPAELVVIDECHHATADSYLSIMEHYVGVPFVGLTATPFRLDGRGLGDIFSEIVVASSTAELCRRGILVMPRVWASKSPDLRGIKVRAGDYAQDALAERTNTAELRGDIVETWLKRAKGKRTVCFAIDVPHSKAIVEEFRKAGISAEHLDSKTPDQERDAILRRLARGETQVVSNCSVLTEGWDLPSLECVIIARPTASINLHMQTIGRVMRACDSKAGAIVLDHAGNHHVHGLVTRELTYSLDGRVRVGEEDPLGMRRCPQCGLFYPNTILACPECGYLPPPPKRQKAIVHGKGELDEFDDSSFEYRRQIWIAIEAEREAAGYKPAWSLFRYRERFDVDPLVVDGELIDPTAATQEQKRAYYAHLVEVAEQRGFQKGWASHRYKEAFGVWPKGFVTDVRDRPLMQQAWRTACQMSHA